MKHDISVFGGKMERWQMESRKGHKYYAIDICLQVGM